MNTAFTAIVLGRSDDCCPEIDEMTAYVKELFDTVVLGIVSIPTDLAFGIRRTYEDVAGSAQIRAENADERARVTHIVKQTARYGISDSGPVAKLVKQIITEYYDLLPDSMMISIAEKGASAAGLQVAYHGGRFAAQTAVANAVTRQLTEQIVRRAAIKRLVTFGVGPAVTAVLLQGTIERASEAAKRLRQTHPRLYAAIRAQQLDMAFFLVEKPLRSVLDGIRDLRNSPPPKEFELMCAS